MIKIDEPSEQTNFEGRLHFYQRRERQKKFVE